LEFERGLIAQRQAREAPEPAGLLAEATERYRAVLHNEPRHEDALHNLALVLADTDPARLDTLLLRELRAVDPSRAGLYDRFRGHQAVTTGRDEAAAQLYFRALGEPGGAAALGDVIGLTRRGVVPVQRLLTELDRVRAVNPGLAADGYLAVVETTSDEAIARDALLSWARTRAAGGTLDSTTLAALPAQADTGISAWLHGTVGRCPADHPDWMDLPRDRLDIAALLALDLGRRQIDAGNSRAAAECWAKTFKRADGAPALDLARELASLIHRHREYDPENQTFRDIEDRLFRDKYGAIQKDDVEAMERLHTTLGLIYSEREESAGARSGDEPDSPRGPKTAISQLRAALEAAARRDRASGVARPQPGIRVLLGAAFVRAGQPLAADTVFLRAAEEFLDLDALPDAEAVLARVSATALGGRASRVTRFLEARNRVARLLNADGEGAPEEACTREIFTSAAPTASSGFAVSASTRPERWDGSDPFLTRQRFKLLADCAALPDTRFQRLYAAEALQMIVEGTSTLRPLPAAADFERLERVLGIVADATTEEPVETRISDVSLDRRLAPDSVAVGIGVGTDPVFAVVPVDAVLAGQALRVFAWLNVPNRFFVDGVDVVVLGDLDVAVVADAQRQLRRLTRRETVVRTQPERSAISAP
jgi:hypothetical protein